MKVIEKRTYEEFPRYHEFRRSDGKGWLGSSETITSASVTVYDSDGSEQSSMTEDVSVYEDTKVRYRLKSGIAGSEYMVSIRIVTSDGNKYEDRLTLRVL